MVHLFRQMINVQARRGLHRSIEVCRGRWQYYNIHKKVTDPARQDPEYFEKAAAKIAIDDHYLERMKKLYEEKISSERSLLLRWQDSLIQHDGKAWLPDIDPKQPRAEFRDIDALTTAPDSVKRMFSIEYGYRSDMTAAWKETVAKDLRKHALDTRSLEVRIANATTTIRHWTLLLEELAKKSDRRPSWLTKKMYELLNYRKKMLMQLHGQDEASFLQILERLKIAYYVSPVSDPEPPKTRKQWVLAQLQHRLNTDRATKLDALKQKIFAERPTLLAEREARLSALNAEEAAIRVELERLKTDDDSVLHVVGTYPGHVIDEMPENEMHAKLFEFDTVKQRLGKSKPWKKRGYTGFI